MRKTLIMGVLSIGILTLVTINTYAYDNIFGSHPGEKALDLSKPENLERLTTGKWEGTWKSFPSGRYGEVLTVFSVDPKTDEEKPVVSRTKRRPAGLLGGPDKFSTSRAKIEGGKLVYSGGLRFNSTVALFEGANGKLVLRGEAQGVGESQGSVVYSELHKIEDGRLSQNFPGE